MEMILRTGEQKKAVEQLLRIKTDNMTAFELNQAAAHLICPDVRVDEMTESVDIQRDGQWRAFAPMTNDADLVAIVRNSMVVIGSHNMYPGDTPYFSAHGFFGETSTDNKDLSSAVCMTAAKLLAHELEFGHEWNKDHEEWKEYQAGKPSGMKP